MKTLKLKHSSQLKGRFKIQTRVAGTDEIISESPWCENLISKADGHGLNLFIRHLFGDVTYPLEITRARFGTTDVTPVETDDDIDSPLVYDIEVALREYVDETTIRYTFFAPNAFIPDDTYYTFAVYCGTQVFSMALIRDFNTVDFVKSGNVDTTIVYEYFIDNV
jgi:hypothetical protein